MIIGNGIDIIDINRIRSVIDKYGNRFKKRCFSISEIERSEKRLNSVESYAKRYAAKEACAKALGTGLARGVFWKDIEVENNQYGMGTSVERASAMTELFRRGESFGIKGYEIDGMDPLSVHLCMKKIYQQVLNENKGPILIEAKTYRYRGHSMSDPGKYRTRQDIQETRENRDPIERVRTFLIENNFYSEDELKTMDNKIKEEVLNASEEARDMDLPKESILFDDVYYEKGINK